MLLIPSQGVSVPLRPLGETFPQKEQITSVVVAVGTTMLTERHQVSVGVSNHICLQVLGFEKRRTLGHLLLQPLSKVAFLGASGRLELFCIGVIARL